MFKHPMINALHELTMTRVRGSLPLTNQDGFTVPFIKDGQEYMLHCYTSRSNPLNLVLSAPQTLMQPLIPANFPVFGDGLIVFGKSPNRDDGYALQAYRIRVVFTYTDQSGRVRTDPLIGDEFLRFSNMRMDSPTLKDDYVTVLNYLMCESDDSFGARFNRLGGPRTLILDEDQSIDDEDSSEDEEDEDSNED